MRTARLKAKLIVPEGDLQPIVQEVIASIDSIHQIVEFPPIPIVFTAAPASFGRYVPGDRRPERIELSLDGPHPRLSFAHEIGHLLDHALNHFDIYATQRRNSPLHAVLKEIERSFAVQTLRNMEAGREPLDSGVRIAQIRYWLQPPELWARAYAQYIAVRSGNDMMSAEVGVSRQLEPFAGYVYVQWETEDFGPIMVIIEEVLRNLGWRQ